MDGLPQDIESIITANGIKDREEQAIEEHNDLVNQIQGEANFNLVAQIMSRVAVGARLAMQMGIPSSQIPDNLQYDTTNESEAVHQDLIPSAVLNQILDNIRNHINEDDEVDDNEVEGMDEEGDEEVDEEEYTDMEEYFDGNEGRVHTISVVSPAGTTTISMIISSLPPLDMEL
jgi:hypothetical protein